MYLQNRNRLRYREQTRHKGWGVGEGRTESLGLADAN